MKNVETLPNQNIIVEQACDWIVKLEGDNPPSQKDVRAFNQWLETSPEHLRVFTSLANHWQDMDILSGLIIPNSHAAKPISSPVSAWLLAPIYALGALKHLLTPHLLTNRLKYSAVATIAMFCTLFMLHFSDPQGPENVYATAQGEQIRQSLPDGSTLWVNSNSMVEVNYLSDKRRINLLKGQAHFEVAKDPNRPFEVYVDDKMIKAIGTAFTVYRLQDRIEVVVTEGKVDLSLVKSTLTIDPSSQTSIGKRKAVKQATQHTDPPQDEIQVLASLEAGQSVAIPVETYELELAIKENKIGDLTRKLSWRDGKLVFAGESLEEVVREVNRHSPVVITMADPELRKLRIGGQFQVGETEALFDVLESGFGIKVSRIDDNYVVLDYK